MVGFAKFDPQAFLESEQRAATNASLARISKDAPSRATNPTTLAAFATLAASSSKNENQDVGESSANDHHNRRENRKPKSVPAKVAKVAKVEPFAAAEHDTSWGERQEERAAVSEYDGGAPRAWSEASARLDPTCPPCDIPPNTTLADF